MSIIQPEFVFIMLCVIPSAISSLSVSFYDKPEYAGLWTFCDETNFDSEDKCNLTERNQYRSVRISKGTCVELNDLKESIWILGNNDNLGHSYYGGYAMKCETNDQLLQCPEGTFVKQIEWDKKFMLTRGIKLRCYKPEQSQDEDAILESHPNAMSIDSEKRKCSAMYGITIKIDEEKDSIISLDMKANCTAGYSKGMKSTCEANTAVSGINITIEKQTDFVKDLRIICNEIPDIIKECEIYDENQVLFSYDGTNANNTVTIKVEKKIGVGYTLLTESNRNAFEFYSKSGFLIEDSINALSDKFECFGVSNGTGFDWSSTPNDTWQNELTINLDIETKSGCEISIIEIVGMCSFIQVRLLQYVRVETCDGDFSNTTVIIPQLTND